MPFRPFLPMALIASVVSICCLTPAVARAQETGAPAAPADAKYPEYHFPRQVRAAGQNVSLHQPTVAQYDPETGAVTLRLPLETTDPVGRVHWAAAELAGTTHLDLGSRLFAVDGLTLAAMHPGAMAEDAASKLGEALPEALPERLVLRLELLLNAPGGPTEPPHTKGISKSPPKLFIRNAPAVLVQIDGEPVLAPVDDFPIEYVANSASDIFHQPSSGRWFLLLDGHWAESKSIEGPWKWIEKKVPVVLTQLSIVHARGHVRRFIQGTKRYRKLFGDDAREQPMWMPEVIVTQEPAELVVLHGDPLFTLVPGVKLMSVANTESDLMFHPRSGVYYLLIAGRWFTADEIDGKWGETYGSLPEEFAKIPRDHIRAHVLWSVPGTPEAAEAARLALLPEKMTLHRRARAAVRYEGAKKKGIESSPIEGTEVRIVTNTEDDVLKIGKAYYCCVRGAWFRSDDGSTKWLSVTELPAKIQALPPGSGLFHANYCRPLGQDGEKGVAFEITGGYSGVFLLKGTPAYGTGWPRRGLWRNKNWYPCARTYGENRWYDPLQGCFQPRSVTYTPDGLPRASEWSPYTASYGRVRMYADRYRQGGKRMFTYVREDDEFRTEAPRPDVIGTWQKDLLERDGLATDAYPIGNRHTETSPEGPAVVADEAGAVYRLAEGKVETYADGKWAPAEKATDAVKSQLAAMERIRARPDQLRSWMAKRAAALPRNPVVTPW